MYMKPSLDSLVLTEDEVQAARKEIQKLAYSKWQAAGCPEDAALTIWQAAEVEWIEYYYVPKRYPKIKVDRQS